GPASRQDRAGPEVHPYLNGKRPGKEDHHAVLDESVRHRRYVWISFGHLLRLGLALPLSVGQAPAAPQRPVEANMAEETVAANLRERVLGRVEVLLSLEHLEVVRQPLPITIRREVDGV